LRDFTKIEGLDSEERRTDPAAVKSEMDEEASKKKQHRSEDGAENGIFPAEDTVLNVASGSEDAISGEYDIELKRCGEKAKSGCEEP
jgi:hypothetical protein